jgi:hypothetical protein
MSEQGMWHERGAHKKVEPMTNRPNARAALR